MRIPIRILTPLGWLAAALGLFAAVVLVLGGLGFRWDPFDLNRRRVDRAETEATAAVARAAVHAAEAEGQAGQIDRLDAAQRSGLALDRATHRSTQTARTADDAAQPLDPDRSARLRDHDRQLCRLAPDLGGCAAASDLAGDGDAPV